MARIEKFVFDLDDKMKDFYTNHVKTAHAMTECTDIPYGQDEICKLDIVYPSDTTDKLPVLINVHGGAWITGDKHYRRGQGLLFADMGMCVVTPNYGLAPQYRYETMLVHLRGVFDWLKAHADEYPMDLTKLFLTGDSAGGQFACLLAATWNSDTFWGRLGLTAPHMPITGAFLACGAYDFARLERNPMAGRIIHDMTGMSRKELADYPYRDLLDTIAWVGEDFPQDVLIMSGRSDVFVGGHERTLADKLDACGKRYFLYRGGGAGDHCFHLRYRSKASQIYYRAVQDYVRAKCADPDAVPLLQSPVQHFAPKDEPQQDGCDC